MQVIVSDSSCLIDLRKGGLLRALLRLPYTVVMPQPLFDDELLSISATEKAALTTGGLEVRELDSAAVTRAARYRREHVALRLNDCFALVLAEDTEDSVLLTGDRRLREVALASGVKAHGVLWATDRMRDHGAAGNDLLRAALEVFRDDPLVFLPEEEIRMRLKRLYRKR